MEQQTGFFWLVLVVILLACLLNVNETDNKLALSAQTITVQQNVVEQEKAIVSILLSPVDRQNVCSHKLNITIAENGDLLLVDCAVKVGDQITTIHYTPVGEVFTIIDPYGSVMGDNGMDGAINFAQTKDKNQTYKNFAGFPVSGTEFATEWQTNFEQLVAMFNCYIKAPTSQKG